MSVALRAARRHVNTFTDESEILQDRPDDVASQDCEAFLQLGIEAFFWLVRADETIRAAVYGGMPHDPRADEAIRELFLAWLRPGNRANQWIQSLSDASAPANLAEFRRCEREVLAIVKSWQGDELTDAMRELRDRALAEHERGETAEFV
jgi:hypothetical protein